MAKVFKKGLSVFLAAMLCVSAMNMLVMAEDATNFKAMKLENIEPGSDGYNYMIAQDLEDGVLYYETSNHAVKIANAGAVHIFPLIDTTRDVEEDRSWTSSGVYDPETSNYDVMYCCDFATGTRVDEEDATRTYYKRVNLEDSEYFSDEQAARLRAIVSVSYPANTVEEAKAALVKAGFDEVMAAQLDRSELISATQGAIWCIANEVSINENTNFTYAKTATTAQKNTWGGYMHDFSGEIGNFTDSTTSRKYLSNPNGVGTRIDALREFLLNELAPVEAGAGQIVISNLSITGAQNAGSDLYTFDVNVALNKGNDGNDDIALYVYVGDDIVNSVPVTEATEYTVSLKAKADANVKVVVSGVQKLEKGVYFYAPAPQDIDGDGVATSREVSQNLIGAGAGDTTVYAEADITFTNVTFKSGSVSNISYMFINKETGEVEFLKKIDVPEGATSAPIITMDGYVSAMFMKQATSGMFWFAEEVDQEIVDATIKCLKANNPSYKGHNAVCFGQGEHDLEFKKNKVVTYDFQAGEVLLGETENVDVTDEKSEVEETETEEPVVEASKNNKNNGKNKDKKNKK